MKRTIIAFIAAIILLLIIVWLAIPAAKSPGFSVGKPLPPGKVKPQLVSTWDTAVLLAPDGSLWAWGGIQFGLQGQFAVQTVTTIPQRIGSDSDWRSVSASSMHTIALKDDGSLWGWGANGSGEIAQPNPTNHFATPVRIGTETNWSQISVGAAHNLALKTDGSLWAWGQNDSGQIGNGTTSNQFTPLLIASGSRWKTIAAGAFNSFALKNDGTVWGWGLDLVKGAGGSNILTSVQIDPGTNWVALSAGDYSVIGLKSDGTLWARGQNISLILPSTSNTARFIRIGQDSDWTEVYDGQNAFFARKRDGSWWIGGDPRGSEAGLGGMAVGSGPPRRLPINFEAWAFANGYRNTLLLAKDGTLWTWGERLGTGKSPSHASWKDTANRILDFLHIKSRRFDTATVTDYSPHRLWELPSATRHSLIANAPPKSPNLSNSSTARTNQP